MTAHGCVFAAAPLQGKIVLVTGGAGAVGHYAVQLAHWAGASVIATVSSEEKAVRARAGGAAHVINYRNEDVAAGSATSPAANGSIMWSMSISAAIWPRLWHRCGTAAASPTTPRTGRWSRRCRCGR